MSVPEIARDILNRYDAGEFDVATIFFNRFQSVISQIPTAQQIIPPSRARRWSRTRSTITSRAKKAILADLLPRGVATQIFTALLENGASEQGARMSAMDNATRNAGDMINKLTIQYNRSRQAAITKELIVISGAEALLTTRTEKRHGTSTRQVTQVIGAVVDVQFDGHRTF